MKITLELETGEAMYALGAISAAGARAHHSRRILYDTGAPIDETGIVEMSADIYDRLEGRLRDLLYPDMRREERLAEIELGIY